jgi:hypothetical protein
MATVPLSGTNIYFYSGIGFNEDYKHTRWHDSISDQQNWFGYQNVVYSESQANFQRIEGQPFIRVNKSVDELWNVNYLSFQNADYAKVFYAFVTKIEYVQKKTCNVYFKIDVIQTWMFDITWKPSFVAREHCQLWNDDGSPIINTIDEGLHYGTEYNAVSVSHFQPYGDLFFLVTVAKKNMHNDANADSAGYLWSKNGLPQPLCFYVHPFLLDGSVPASNMTLNEQIGLVMQAMYESTDAVNNIVSMYVTNYLPDNPAYDGTTINFNTNYYQNVMIGSLNTVFCHSVNYQTGVYDMGAKYDGFTTVSESKLMMYPYQVTILTDMKGNQVEIKNEYVNNTNLVLDVNGSFGISNKISYAVKDYNTTITDDTFRTYISLQHGVIDNNPNDIPVLVDSLAAYIQGNRNSLANQKNAIMFNGVTNAIGNSIGAIASGARGDAAGVASSVTGMVSGAGNTVLQLQGLQAKQKDISNIPPAISNLGNNTYFDFGNGYTGVWIIKKEITPEYRQKLHDFFNMYGYKKNETKVPNFHTRQYFNYVQTVDCIITGNINNDDLEEIKTAYNNGITLWHMDDIGNYNYGNGVIANG